MPVVSPSAYQAPFGFSNGHIQTIFPQLRKVAGVVYKRERIDTPDEDFLDLDWATVGSRKLAILSHGLEGNSQRPYVLGMVRALHKRGWDALAWNYRGCSGEPNRQLRWYHSGETGDLDFVIQHALHRNSYEEIALIGFSLGGNVVLKYMGEQGSTGDQRITKAVTLSVPCALKSSAIRLADRSNILYMERFLRSIEIKIREKAKRMPEAISATGYEKIRTFTELDDRYTAPIHGFQSAEDYFERCSARQFLPRVRVPTLLINAKNDPFLAAESFPIDEAQNSSHFYFESPASGGHMGFVTFGNQGEYWSETRTLEFLS